MESEANCEAVTALITQRSQVQILPPLQEKSQVRAGFVGHTDPALAFDVSTLSADTASREPQRGCVANNHGRGRTTAEADPGDLFANDPEVAVGPQPSLARHRRR